MKPHKCQTASQTLLFSPPNLCIADHILEILFNVPNYQCRLVIHFVKNHHIHLFGHESRCDITVMSHNTCQSTSMWCNNWTFSVCFELPLVGMHSPCTVSICTPHLVFFAARLQHSEFLPQRYSPDLHSILHIFNGTILCPLYDLIHSVFKLQTSNILYHWIPKTLFTPFT